MQETRKHLIALCWVMLIIFVLFIKPLFLHLSFQDPSAFHYDLLWGLPSILGAIGDLFKTGHPHLWSINQNMGTPLVGLYLPTVLHPLVLMFFYFSMGTTTALLALVNMELLAVFTYLAFRKSGASDFGSASAIFLAVFSGFIPWINAIYPIATPLPWIMCWIWTCMEINDRPRLSMFAWNSVAVFFILISGDAQLVVLSAYLLPCWFLIYSLKSRYPLRTVGRSLMVLSGGAAAAWILSSVQIIPAILFFSKAVTVRTPVLGEYLNTYPPAHHTLLAGAGLFTRLFHNLFLPFSVPLLVLCAIFRRRQNPAVFASMVLGGVVLALALGGKYGLGAIPFHLPLLKSFIRHYKLGIALQAPFLIVAAIGFDEFVDLLKNKSRRWEVFGLVCLALTLVVVRSLAFAALMAVISAYVIFAVYKSRMRYVAAAIFALIALDLMSFAWKTPYPLKIPDFDPVYEKYVKKADPHHRVQGMYPWTARAGSELDQPQPVHGTGYSGEASIDSWIQYPLTNHAYFLAAICPEVADIEDGVFANVDFSTCFKSTDFVNKKNRDLVNLAAIRYFFLQDFALQETDLYPLLSDPRYLANPARPKPYGPFSRLPRGTYKRKEVKAAFGVERPVLEADRPGAFTYQSVIKAGTVLESVMAWRPWSLEHPNPKKKAVKLDSQGTKKSSAEIFWGTLTCETGGGVRLLQARAASPSSGSVKTKVPLMTTTKETAKLRFSYLPLDSSQRTGSHNETADRAVFYWVDPRLWDRSNTIKYREGERLIVFENTESMGRTRIVHRSSRVPENEKAMKIMRSSKYDPKTETIFMDPQAPLLKGPEPLAKESSEIVEQFQDETVVKAELQERGLLVLADTFYPGWRAFDEHGKEHMIWRADLNLRAVFLPAGSHKVRFVFNPWDIRVGLFATLSAFLFLLASLLVRIILQRRAQ